MVSTRQYADSSIDAQATLLILEKGDCAAASEAIRTEMHVEVH